MQCFSHCLGQDRDCGLEQTCLLVHLSSSSLTSYHNPNLFLRQPQISNQRHWRDPSDETCDSTQPLRVRQATDGGGSRNSTSAAANPRRCNTHEPEPEHPRTTTNPTRSVTTSTTRFVAQHPRTRTTKYARPLQHSFGNSRGGATSRHAAAIPFRLHSSSTTMRTPTAPDLWFSSSKLNPDSNGQ
ncbi:uncharacterized protein LOC111015235 isoform X1 [Momordica charantia]|uniref:Uncharacterized protein LOC111015235 isoform X1 n=1 Tax=Momordica charantia TaxID=3673 RepID=A0A6J1CVS2_MOMCH|nr:uncharacterized protein LOC111015235 isoform X1 [Momordica charantia]